MKKAEVQFPHRGIKKWIPLAIWKLPYRLWAWVAQVFWPLIALIRWMGGGFQKNWDWKGLGYSTVKWPLRLLTKTLDVLAVGEIIDGLAILFNPGVRKLSELEIREARLVFGEAFPYWRVRILEESHWAQRWAKKYNSSGLAFVVCRLIRFSKEISPQAGNRDMQWLIHELVHVAQMESIGLQYIPEALYAQRTGGYDYGGVSNLSGKKLWNFNREQQARIVEDYYGYLRAGNVVPDAFLPYINNLRSGHFVQ